MTCSGVPFPEIQISSWDNSEIADPAGTRHLVSGAFAYDKLLGIGCELALTFNNLQLDAGAAQPFVGSDVAVINFCVPNFGELQASGLQAVYNMKLWLPSGSGTILDLPGSHLEVVMSGVWIPNASFPSGTGAELQRSLPGAHNVFKHDGEAELTSYTDDEVSQYVYMRMFLDEQFPLGTFGVCGSGILRPRLTFDFY
jgi:hypothetical protein